jgi:hypothetical protein
MRILRVATDEDLQRIIAYEDALKEYRVFIESNSINGATAKVKKTNQTSLQASSTQ